MHVLQVYNMTDIQAAPKVSLINVIIIVIILSTANDQDFSVCSGVELVEWKAIDFSDS